MSASAANRERLRRLSEGLVIPASPLALKHGHSLDERHQRAVYRYYAAAGAGGIAVAVHTTQFEIRDPAIGLHRPLLELAAEEIDRLNTRQPRPILKIAGICGGTKQALAEAATAAALGYDAGLLSLGALKSASEDELVEHCRRVAEIIPLIGFYLQPAVGGRLLPFRFWRQFAEIENVVAIKMAPFNRYQTIDVVRGVALAGRENDIALYTGNDDNIIADLISPYAVQTPSGTKVLRIRGGLLGQFSVWTKTFVELLAELHAIVDAGGPVPAATLRRNIELTDANAAIFDAANGFAGCIPGINEVLRRQGLLESNACLNPSETLSPGQSEEIDRVCRDYPWLPDDHFVKQHLDTWLA